jgi:hypothetical protein
VEPELHELTNQSNNMTTQWIPREILFSSMHETVTKMSAIKKKCKCYNKTNVSLADKTKNISNKK